MAKKKKFPISNKELVEETKKSQAAGKMTERLGYLILKMAQNYTGNRIRRANFAGYTYREDMVSEAVLHVCRSAWRIIDLEKYSNAYAYYTSTIHNAYLQVLNSEKSSQDLNGMLIAAAGSENISFSFADRYGTYGKDSPALKYEVEFEYEDF